MDERLANALAALPVILLLTFTNVIIASVMGMATFLHLQFVSGWSLFPSEAVAVLVAIATYLYIWWQPKIRSYTSARSQ